MSNQETRKTAGEIYIAVCKNRQNAFFRPKVDDVLALIKAIQRELLLSFESSFLNACYSVWARYAGQVNIRDCTYSPRIFRVTKTNEPYALTSNDAYFVIKMLADDVANEDIRGIAEAWLNLHAGKKYDYPNPMDHTIDNFLKCIDENLIRVFRDVLRKHSELEYAFSREPNAKRLIEAAKTEAGSIIEQARNQERKILAEARRLEQEGSRLRKEGELAAGVFYARAEKAELMRKEEAKDLLEQSRRDAQQIIDTAKKDAEKQLADSRGKADALLEKARAKANDMTQNALEEKRMAQNAGLKEKFDLVLSRFSETQEAMRSLEAQLDQVQLLDIFDTFYSLYDIIGLNIKSLASLPEEYSYIVENMSVFQEIIQEGLAKFGIRTIITESGSPFVGKFHEVEGKMMFDPARAKIKHSLRPGFVNSATDNVLKKEQVEIICI